MATSCPSIAASGRQMDVILDSTEVLPPEELTLAPIRKE